MLKKSYRLFQQTVTLWGIYNFLFISKAFAQGGGAGSVEVPNPLSSTDIVSILRNIAGFLMFIAAPIVIIMIIWAGFLIMGSGGDETKIKSGKSTLIYAVVGYGVILISWGVLTLIRELLGANP